MKTFLLILLAPILIGAFVLLIAPWLPPVPEDDAL